MTKYIPTIGIEVHVELKTKSKAFSSSANEYGITANSSTNVIDLGYPGTLPLVNKEMVELGIKAATLLHAQISKEMHFDRKNYFYPDNPKNYQITQAKTPIGYDGYIEIFLNDESKKIEIERLHMEEDTSKSIHKDGVTLLDFNRAGVPLIEIVTKPCLHSSEEAVLYLEKLRETLFYGGISDCKIEEGSMRCDANISIQKEGIDSLGVKCEVKNIGSIRNVGLSINEEIKRQTALLEQGEVLVEQTRRFDDKKGTTVLMRVKETGNDYRYFPEPDIPYIYLTDEEIAEAIKDLPIMPDDLRKTYKDKGISLINANKMIQNKQVADFINTMLEENINFEKASNLLVGDISSYLNKTNKMLKDTKLTKERFMDLLSKLDNGTITLKIVKDILEDIMESDTSIEVLLEEKGLTNLTDENELEKIIEETVLENPQSVTDFKEGKDRAVKFLMGQIMKKTKGSANPSLANQILTTKLKEQ